MLKRHFKMSDLGEIHYILGWNVRRNCCTRTIMIDQRTIPMDSGLWLNKVMASQSAKDTEFMADKPYRQLVGSLMYLVVSTRPDLAYLAHELSKFVNNPGPTDEARPKVSKRYITLRTRARRPKSFILSCPA
ncbi:TPA: hypothetical protein N0F65_009246 [Lagenidium giganteum]|uniref:Mitochondrial protein n=1 Tax=Lagenidium giganteum TaxID=4803 RepID=A0AAV2YET0_9STRA|nr:TPA: hypothetical protein N0F65_009246 [Lagenidium giganteum]